MAGVEKPVGAARSAASRFNSTTAWAVYIYLMLPSFIVVPMSFGDKWEAMFPPNTLSVFLYGQYFNESNWMAATFMSLRVAVVATIIALLLGVPAAYGLVRGNYPGKRIVTLFLLSPILCPIIVAALGLYLYYSSLGITGTDLAVALSHAMYTTPFVIVVCMAGMRHIDQNLETAATIMGASVMQTFRKVTLPLLRPAMLAGGLFAFLMSFDEVVIAYFIAQAGNMTLPVKMFSAIRWEVSPVIAAVSALLTGLSLVICLLGASLQRRS